MSVSLAALEYLWMEAVPLSQDVTRQLGLEENIETETEFRIEKHGFNVGRGLAHVATRNEDRYFGSNFEIVKFLSKELWMLLFGNHIDAFKTNHTSVFLLTDNNFTMCMRMSTNKGIEETVKQASPYLWFPAGIIRGYLHAMGIDAKVSFNADDLPAVRFEIYTT